MSHRFLHPQKNHILRISDIENHATKIEGKKKSDFFFFFYTFKFWFPIVLKIDLYETFWLVFD